MNLFKIVNEIRCRYHTRFLDGITIECQAMLTTPTNNKKYFVIGKARYSFEDHCVYPTSPDYCISTHVDRYKFDEARNVLILIYNYGRIEKENLPEE